ncbi:MAG: gamma-glutamyl-gamma-aminobutyrate hydrolase family protein [Anaerolineae bacterium]
MIRRPLIGITAYNYIKPSNGWRYDVSYGKNAVAIEDAGGLPVLIPSMVAPDTLRGIYERLDGVLLPGGGDVNPSQYRAQREDGITLYDISDERDTMEIAMARWAIDDDLPVFGICRGIQVFNVALGGTLVQDISAQRPSDLRHNITSPQEEPRNTILHDVLVESGTLLASILTDERVPVNSLHHQALRDVAPGVTINALSPDGLIEGLELPDKHFALAVQWHPEDLIEDDARMRNLFTAFVASARERLLTR